jgi:hypothetical protein
MTRHRDNTVARLASLGINANDSRKLIRASQTLSTWGEHECNGAIQQDDATGQYYWYSQDGRKLSRAIDRESGAVRRAQAIASKYGLEIYYQTDPRGCALYVLRPDDIPQGRSIDSCYSNGVAVVP